MGSSIVLQWNVPTGVTHPIDGWYILRSDSADGLFTPLLPDLTVVPVPDSGTTATYTDENVIVGKQYWYELEAVRQELPLADSSTPIIDISPPETSSPAVAEGLTVPLPTSLQAGYAGYGRVGLSWSFDESSVPGLLGFDVYRYKGTGSTDPAGLSFIPTNATYLFGQDKQFEFYTDDNLDGSNAGYYFYRIVAAVDDGNGNEVYSAPSNVAVVDTTTNPSSAPAAPTLDSAQLDGGQVTVTWQDNSLDETEFDIYRRNGSGAFAEIGSVTQDQTTFSDTAVVPGSTYYYFVSATNEYVVTSLSGQPQPDDSHSSALALLSSFPTPAIGLPSLERHTLIQMPH